MKVKWKLPYSLSYHCHPETIINCNFTNKLTIIGIFPLLLTKVKNRDNLATIQ